MAKNPFLKALSLSLAFVFTVESSVWAVPDPLALHSAAGSANGIAGIEIPESLGTLQSRYIPETPVSGKPFIIHIQDAHAQPEAQRNIQAILDYLVKNKKIQKIAVEAAFGKMEPKQFEFFKDPAANRLMADHLTEMGELTGAELFAMGPGSVEVELYGIEDEAIYMESFRTFRQVKSRKKETEEVLRAYEKGLDQTEARVFSKDLWNWIKKKKDWDEKKDEALDYFRALRELAAKYLKLDLSDAANQFEWPNLARLLKAEETETKFNRETAVSQMRELTLSFSQSDVISRRRPRNLAFQRTGIRNDKQKRLTPKTGFLLEGLDLLINNKPFAPWLAANAAFPEIKTSRRFFELLYEEAQRLKVSLLNYPDFLTLGGLLILREELDSGGLFKELKTLEERLEGVVVKSEKEKKLLQIAKDFSLLRKLFALEMSREDYEIYTARKQELTPEVFQKRVNVIASPGGAKQSKSFEIASSQPSAAPRNDMFPLLPSDVLALSEKFYELSRQRDRVLMENTLKGAAKDKATVLIAGGFHSEGFTAFLKSEKIPYLVITPKITHFANDGLYEKVMMGENANLEELTAKGDKLGRIFFTSLLLRPELLKEMEITPQQLQAVAAKVILENVIPGLSEKGEDPAAIQNALNSFIEEHRWIFGNTRFIRLESGNYTLEAGEVLPAPAVAAAEAPVPRAKSEVRMTGEQAQMAVLLLFGSAVAAGAVFRQLWNKSRSSGAKKTFTRDEQAQTAEFYDISISTAPVAGNADDPEIVVIGGPEAAADKAATSIKFLYPRYEIVSKTPSTNSGDIQIILSRVARSEVRDAGKWLKRGLIAAAGAALLVGIGLIFNYFRGGAPKPPDFAVKPLEDEKANFAKAQQDLPEMKRFIENHFELEKLRVVDQAWLSDFALWYLHPDAPGSRAMAKRSFSEFQKTAQDRTKDWIRQGILAPVETTPKTVAQEEKQIPAYRFAAKYTPEQLVKDAKAREGYMDLVAYWQGKGFYRDGIGFNEKSGLTYNGHPIDYETGQLAGSAWNWSSPAHESLNVNILTQILAGSKRAALLLSPDNPAMAEQKALRFFENKMNSYEKFNREYPGYGGFFPWGTVTDEGLQPSKDWRDRTAGLDGAQLFWALYGAEDVLRKKGHVQLADRVKTQWDFMRKNLTMIFYEGDGKVRAEAGIRDNEVQPSKDNYYDYPQVKKGEAYYLDNPVTEDVLMLYALELFSDLPAREKEKIWQNSRKKLQAVEFETPQGVLTTYRGHWKSAHEEWSKLILPFREVPLAWEVFVNGEKARAWDANMNKRGGLLASGHAAQKEIVYRPAVGIPKLARERIEGADFVMSYAVFPGILANENYGTAWHVNMLKARRMQGPHGTGESIRTDGTDFAPVLTWDAVMLPSVAMNGGIVEIVSKKMKQDGLSERFREVTAREYKLAFPGEIKGKNVPFVLPNTVIPDRMKHFTIVSEKEIVVAVEVLKSAVFNGEGDVLETAKKNAVKNPGTLVLASGQQGYVFWPVKQTDLGKTPFVTFEVSSSGGPVMWEFKNTADKNIPLGKVAIVFPATQGVSRKVTIDLSQSAVSANQILALIVASDPKADATIHSITLTPQIPENSQLLPWDGKQYLRQTRSEVRAGVPSLEELRENTREVPLKILEVAGKVSLTFDSEKAGLKVPAGAKEIKLQDLKAYFPTRFALLYDKTTNSGYVYDVYGDPPKAVLKELYKANKAHVIELKNDGHPEAQPYLDKIRDGQIVLIVPRAEARETGERPGSVLGTSQPARAEARAQKEEGIKSGGAGAYGVGDNNHRGKPTLSKEKSTGLSRRPDIQAGTSSLPSFLDTKNPNTIASRPSSYNKILAKIVSDVKKLLAYAAERVTANTVKNTFAMKSLRELSKNLFISLSLEGFMAGRVRDILLIVNNYFIINYKLKRGSPASISSRSEARAQRKTQMQRRAFLAPIEIEYTLNNAANALRQLHQIPKPKPQEKEEVEISKKRETLKNNYTVLEKRMLKGIEEKYRSSIVYMAGFLERIEKKIREEKQSDIKELYEKIRGWIAPADVQIKEKPDSVLLINIPGIPEIQLSSPDTKPNNPEKELVDWLQNLESKNQIELFTRIQERKGLIYFGTAKEDLNVYRPEELRRFLAVSIRVLPPKRSEARTNFDVEKFKTALVNALESGHQDLPPFTEILQNPWELKLAGDVQAPEKIELSFTARLVNEDPDGSKKRQQLQNLGEELRQFNNNEFEITQVNAQSTPSDKTFMYVLTLARSEARASEFSISEQTIRRANQGWTVAQLLESEHRKTDGLEIRITFKAGGVRAGSPEAIGQYLISQLTAIEGVLAPVRFEKDLPKPALPISTTQLTKQEEITALEIFLGELKKEQRHPGTGEVPVVSFISDQHGAINKFGALILDSIRQALPGRLPKDFKLNPYKSLEEQLLAVSITLQELKGKIHFANIGDLMDRGPFGIKVSRWSKELIEAGLADFIPGNHDQYVMLNLWGIHLPWYDQFEFYGYKDEYDAQYGRVEDLVKTYHEKERQPWQHKIYWAQLLYEYNNFYKDLTKKKDWKKIYFEFNGDLDEKGKRKKESGLYAQLMKEAKPAAPQKAAWDKFRGWYEKGGIEVSTGIRDIGGMSLQWWKELLAEFKSAYPDVDTRPGAVKRALEVMEGENGIIPVLQIELEQKLKEGKWWWRVFQAIDSKPYESIEWLAKDWAYHKDWGTAVIDELNDEQQSEQTRARLAAVPDDERAKARQELQKAGLYRIVYNQKNYLKSPELQEISDFYHEHFQLHIRDIYQNDSLHAWLPVDEQGRFHFIFNQVNYLGKGDGQNQPSVWEGLAQIAETVKSVTFSFEDMHQIHEAISLLGIWYGDNTTEAKVPDVAKVIKIQGAAKLAEANGFNRLYSGHLPFHEFSKLKPEDRAAILGAIVDGRIIFTDHGMGVRYGSRGAVVAVSPNGAALRGYEHAGHDEIISSPRTVSIKDGKENVLFENKGIPREVFLPQLITEVKARLDALRSEARSENIVNHYGNITLEMRQENEETLYYATRPEKEPKIDPANQYWEVQQYFRDLYNAISDFAKTNGKSGYEVQVQDEFYAKLLKIENPPPELEAALSIARREKYLGQLDLFRLLAKLRGKSFIPLYPEYEPPNVQPAYRVALLVNPAKSTLEPLLFRDLLGNPSIAVDAVIGVAPYQFYLSLNSSIYREFLPAGSVTYNEQEGWVNILGKKITVVKNASQLLHEDWEAMHLNGFVATYDASAQIDSLAEAVKVSKRAKTGEQALHTHLLSVEDLNPFRLTPPGEGKKNTFSQGMESKRRIEENNLVLSSSLVHVPAQFYKAILSNSVFKDVGTNFSLDYTLSPYLSQPPLDKSGRLKSGLHNQILAPRQWSDYLEASLKTAAAKAGSKENPVTRVAISSIPVGVGERVKFSLKVLGKSSVNSLLKKLGIARLRGLSREQIGQQVEEALLKNLETQFSSSASHFAMKYSREVVNTDARFEKKILIDREATRVSLIDSGTQALEIDFHLVFNREYQDARHLLQVLDEIGEEATRNLPSMGVNVDERLSAYGKQVQMARQNNTIPPAPLEIPEKIEDLTPRPLRLGILAPHGQVGFAGLRTLSYFLNLSAVAGTGPTLEELKNAVQMESVQGPFLSHRVEMPIEIKAYDRTQNGDAVGEVQFGEGNPFVLLRRYAAPNEIPWAKYRADFVVDGSGEWDDPTDPASILGHLNAGRGTETGAVGAFLTAPFTSSPANPDEIKRFSTLVYPLNMGQIAKQMANDDIANIFSNASCTTNCAVFITEWGNRFQKAATELLKTKYGIPEAELTNVQISQAATIHAPTNTQQIRDAITANDQKGASRRRSALESILASSGASQAIKQLGIEKNPWPLAFIGFAVRVGLSTTSLVYAPAGFGIKGLNEASRKKLIAAKKDFEKDLVKAAEKAAKEMAKDPKFKDAVRFAGKEEALTSGVVVGSKEGAILDGQQIQALFQPETDLIAINLLAWYDNVNGYMWQASRALNEIAKVYLASAQAVGQAGRSEVRMSRFAESPKVVGLETIQLNGVNYRVETKFERRPFTAAEGDAQGNYEVNVNFNEIIIKGIGTHQEAEAWHSKVAEAIRDNPSDFEYEIRNTAAKAGLETYFGDRMPWSDKVWNFSQSLGLNPEDPAKRELLKPYLPFLKAVSSGSFWSSRREELKGMVSKMDFKNAAEVENFFLTDLKLRPRDFRETGEYLEALNLIIKIPGSQSLLTTFRQIKDMTGPYFDLLISQHTKDSRAALVRQRLWVGLWLMDRLIHEEMPERLRFELTTVFDDVFTEEQGARPLLDGAIKKVFIGNQYSARFMKILSGYNPKPSELIHSTLFQVQGTEGRPKYLQARLNEIETLRDHFGPETFQRLLQDWGFDTVSRWAQAKEKTKQEPVLKIMGSLDEKDRQARETPLHHLMRRLSGMKDPELMRNALLLSAEKGKVDDILSLVELVTENSADFSPLTAFLIVSLNIHPVVITERQSLRARWLISKLLHSPIRDHYYLALKLAAAIPHPGQFSASDKMRAAIAELDDAENHQDRTHTQNELFYYMRLKIHRDPDSSDVDLVERVIDTLLQLSDPISTRRLPPHHVEDVMLDIIGADWTDPVYSELNSKLSREIGTILWMAAGKFPGQYPELIHPVYFLGGDVDWERVPRDLQKSKAYGYAQKLVELYQKVQARWKQSYSEEDLQKYTQGRSTLQALKAFHEDRKKNKEELLSPDKYPLLESGPDLSEPPQKFIFISDFGHNYYLPDESNERGFPVKGTLAQYKEGKYDLFEKDRTLALTQEYLFDQFLRQDIERLEKELFRASFDLDNGQKVLPAQVRRPLEEMLEGLGLVIDKLTLDGLADEKLELLGRLMRTQSLTVQQMENLLSLVGNAADQFYDYYNHHFGEYPKALAGALGRAQVAPQYLKENDNHLPNSIWAQRVQETFIANLKTGEGALTLLTRYVEKIQEILEAMKAHRDWLIRPLPDRGVQGVVTKENFDAEIHSPIEIGSKAFELFQLKKAKMPIPPLVTLPADLPKRIDLKATEDYDPKLNPEFRRLVLEAILQLEKETGRAFYFGEAAMTPGELEFIKKFRLGAEKNVTEPLFFSVRSGSFYSMPGLMDTVLNLPFNARIIEDLIHRNYPPEFVYDTARRFIDSYGQAYGIDPRIFSRIIDLVKDDVAQKRGLRRKDIVIANFTSEELQETYRLFQMKLEVWLNKKGIKDTNGMMKDPFLQVLGAVLQIYDSWNSEGAVYFRQKSGISEDFGTSVTLQAMVFGNRGPQSGTAVIFTRDPDTGSRTPVGIAKMKSQGPDLVGGRTEVFHVFSEAEAVFNGKAASFEKEHPQFYKKIMETIIKPLEQLKDAPQDVEISWDESIMDADGLPKIFLLQTRPLALINRVLQKKIILPKNFDPQRILAKGKGVSSNAAVGRILDARGISYAELKEKIEALRAQMKEKGEEDLEILLVFDYVTDDDAIKFGIGGVGGILGTKLAVGTHASLMARRLGLAFVGLDSEAMKMDFANESSTEPQKIHFGDKEFEFGMKGPIISMDGYPPASATSGLSSETSGHIILGPLDMLPYVQLPASSTQKRASFVKAVRSEVRAHATAGALRSKEEEVKAIESIVKHFPQNGPNDRSVEIEALLAALYGGSIQYYTSTPVKKNEKTVWQQHRYDGLAGAFNLRKGRQGDKAIRLTQSQTERVDKFVEAARKRLLELGIRMDHVIPKAYGKTIGWILSRDPAYQNPFLHTFLGVGSELIDVTSAQSRLERAVDVGRFSSEDEAYLRRYDDVFQPYIPSSSGRQPYVNRIKHNNARGPYKGGERFIFSDSLKADDLFMERFNDLVRKGFNLQELRYFLRKWVREETLPLAFGMTTKAAVAQLPYGGGKGSVLFADIFEEKKGVKTIQDLFTGEAADSLKNALIRHQARVLFKAGKIGPQIDIPAPDVGSNALHMDQMTDELLLTIYEEARKDGSIREWPENVVKKFEAIQKEKLSPLTAPYLKAVTEESAEFRKKKSNQGIPLPPALKMLAETRATFTSKSTQFGGSIFRGPATGYGGILVLEKVLEKENRGPLRGKTVKLMGFGNVGQWAAKRLIEQGAVIELISQGPYGIVYKKGGFSADDLEKLEGLNRRYRSFHLLMEDADFKIQDAVLVGEEEFLDYPMDIHILAAKENSIHKGNVEKVADSIYLELANGGITNEAYDVLLQSGALIIPDSIANAGGVTVSYFEWLQNLRGEQWSEKQVIEELDRMLVEGVERADRVRTEFQTDWRTAADILMIREVLEARNQAGKSRRSEARLAGAIEKPIEIKTETQRLKAEAQIEKGLAGQGRSLEALKFVVLAIAFGFAPADLITVSALFAAYFTLMYGPAKAMANIAQTEITPEIRQQTGEIQKAVSSRRVEHQIPAGDAEKRLVVLTAYNGKIPELSAEDLKAMLPAGGTLLLLESGMDHLLRDQYREMIEKLKGEIFQKSSILIQLKMEKTSYPQPTVEGFEMTASKYRDHVAIFILPQGYEGLFGQLEGIKNQAIVMAPPEAPEVRSALSFYLGRVKPENIRQQVPDGLSIFSRDENHAVMVQVSDVSRFMQQMHDFAARRLLESAA